jgi:hypothetical protein
MAHGPKARVPVAKKQNRYGAVPLSSRTQDVAHLEVKGGRLDKGSIFGCHGLRARFLGADLPRLSVLSRARPQAVSCRERMIVMTLPEIREERAIDRPPQREWQIASSGYAGAV